MKELKRNGHYCFIRHAIGSSQASKQPIRNVKYTNCCPCFPWATHGCPVSVGAAASRAHCKQGFNMLGVPGVLGGVWGSKRL